MTETMADMQTVVSRLSFLEGQLHQLRDLVSAQLAPQAAETMTSHRYITRVDTILTGEPIITGTRTPVRAVVEHWKFGDAPEGYRSQAASLTAGSGLRCFELLRRPSR